jgi:hypothetical protein
MIDARNAFVTQQVVVVLLGVVLVVALGTLLWRGLLLVARSSAVTPAAQPTRRARASVIAMATAVGAASLAVPPIVPPLVALTCVAAAAGIAFAFIAVFPRSAKLFRGQVRSAEMTAAPPWRAGVRWGDALTPIGAVLLCAVACAAVTTPPWRWAETVALIQPAGNLVRYTPFPGWALSLPMLFTVIAQMVVGQVALFRLSRPPRIQGAARAVAAADAEILERFVRSLTVLVVTMSVAHLVMIGGAGLQAVSVAFADTTSAAIELLQPSHAIGSILLGCGILGWATSVGGILWSTTVALRRVRLLVVPVPP